MKSKKAMTFAAIATAAVVMLAGCASGGNSGSSTAPSTAPKVVKDLVIYTARAKPITDYVVGAFEKAYPEYSGKVQILNLGAAAIPDRVRAEKTNPQASLWWGGTQQNLSLGVKDGLLQPWKDASFAREIDPAFKDADGRWYAEYQLPQVIVYNSDALKAADAPQDWSDLILPKWKGKVVIRDVAPSGGMRSIFDSMILNASPDGTNPTPGYDFLRKLDANTVDYAADPSDLYLKLSRQLGTVTAWNLQDTLIQINQNKMPFGYLVPKSGSPVLVDGLGIVAGAPNVDGAKLFAEFLFKQDVRTKLANDFYQIPVTKIAEQPAWLKALNLKKMDINWSVAATNEPAWIEYWTNNIKNKH